MCAEAHIYTYTNTKTLLLIFFNIFPSALLKPIIVYVCVCVRLVGGETKKPNLILLSIHVCIICMYFRFVLLKKKTKWHGILNCQMIISFVLALYIEYMRCMYNTYITIYTMEYTIEQTLRYAFKHKNIYKKRKHANQRSSPILSIQMKIQFYFIFFIL